MGIISLRPIGAVYDLTEGDPLDVILVGDDGDIVTGDGENCLIEG